MRLIDADLLMENLSFMDTEEEREENVGEIITWEDADRMPTAFDVEKVLNELKHEESEALRRYSESKGTAYAFSDKCSCDNWAKAIEIVKRGGRDERQ